MIRFALMNVDHLARRISPLKETSQDMLTMCDFRLRLSKQRTCGLGVYESVHFKKSPQLAESLIKILTYSCVSKSAALLFGKWYTSMHRMIWLHKVAPRTNMLGQADAND